MSYETNIARGHRRRAVELRAMASDETERKLRSRLLELAADYECLALRIEALDTTQVLRTTESHLT